MRNACFCRKCGRVFPAGIETCPRCRSASGLLCLRPGKAIPISQDGDGWYRDVDNGRRWVAVTTSEGVRLMEPESAPYMIRASGRRVRGPYGEEIVGDLLLCREDWETPDGVRWTFQWLFRIGTDVAASGTIGACEVVG